MTRPEYIIDALLEAQNELDMQASDYMLGDDKDRSDSFKHAALLIDDLIYEVKNGVRPG